MTNKIINNTGFPTELGKELLNELNDFIESKFITHSKSEQDLLLINSLLKSAIDNTISKAKNEKR